MPRKNGKSPFAAGILLLLMLVDREPGAQIYSAAAEREQAAIVFRHASGMINSEPELAGRCKVLRSVKAIEVPAMNTVFKALTADADTKHGLNAHGIVIDELHAHRDGELVDVLMTSTGSRRQPLVVHITTADYDRPSICNTKRDYAAKVRDGLIKDSSFLPVLYEADATVDDWRDQRVWARVNPNLGVSVKLDYLARECQRAQDEPTYENTFKRLHLNMRTEQAERWMQLERWDACKVSEFPDLRGRRCVAGLDLASRIDVAAFVLLFPPEVYGGRWYVKPRFFVPADNARKREKRDRVPYETWGRLGLVNLTPGNVIDYQAIRSQIVLDAKTYRIEQIAADRWNLEALRQQLEAEGGPKFVEFGQGFRDMSEPAKELERLVVSGQLAHDGHEVMRWMVGNVAIKRDEASNIKPDREKSRDKIDGVVALTMAIGRAMRDVPDRPLTAEDILG